MVSTDVGVTTQTKPSYVQPSTAQPSPTQPSPTQPNPTQPNPAQSSPALPCSALLVRTMHSKKLKQTSEIIRDNSLKQTSVIYFFQFVALASMQFNCLTRKEGSHCPNSTIHTKVPRCLHRAQQEVQERPKAQQQRK